MNQKSYTYSLHPPHNGIKPRSSPRALSFSEQDNRGNTTSIFFNLSEQHNIGPIREDCNERKSTTVVFPEVSI